MKVLSLFDGISCGMVALEKAGIEVEKYTAYEIEKNAIKVSKKNYPCIEHMGDVTKADFTSYKGYDLLIGGSPCQSLSIVRSQTREHLDGKSKLFFEYARALKEINPKYFLFENVASMNQESKDIISEVLGCEPVLINSNCFVAQDRPRLYWTKLACNGGGHQKKVLSGNRARKLTPVEYERLQGIPDNYTDCVANTHRYNALGNGWTVDVIAFILKGIKESGDQQ